MLNIFTVRFNSRRGTFLTSATGYFLIKCRDENDWNLLKAITNMKH